MLLWTVCPRFVTNDFFSNDDDDDGDELSTGTELDLDRVGTTTCVRRTLLSSAAGDEVLDMEDLMFFERNACNAKLALLEDMIMVRNAGGW